MDEQYSLHQIDCLFHTFHSFFSRIFLVLVLSQIFDPHHKVRDFQFTSILNSHGRSRRKIRGGGPDVEAPCFSGLFVCFPQKTLFIRINLTIPNMLVKH